MNLSAAPQTSNYEQDTVANSSPEYWDGEAQHRTATFLSQAMG